MLSARFLLPILLSCTCGTAFAIECVPREQPVATLEVEVERASRVSRPLLLPAGTRVLIETLEYGNNVRVELQEDGVSRRADNALRRWAPQRMLLSAGRSRPATISVIGQERTRGRAEIRIYRVGATDDRRCMAFWAHSAAADEQFSTAEQISSGKLDGARGAASRAYGTAVREYGEAVAAVRSLGGTLLPQAQLTLSAAQIIGLQAWEEAAANATAAEQGFVSAGHEYGRDRARFFWARTQLYLAKRAPDRAAQERQLDRAHETFLAISDSHRQRGESYDSAFALTWAAFAQYMADRFEENILENQRALEAFEPLDEPVRKVQLRQNIANSQFEIGRFQEALANYAAALQAADPESELDMYQLIVMNIAYTEFRLGKPDAALRHYSEALRLARRMQSEDDEARSLHGLGTTYSAIGNFHEATSYLERALEMRTAARDEAGRSATLLALADVLRDAGRVREALARHEQALGIGVQSPIRVARIRVEMARDHLDLGELAAATDVLRAVLDDEKLDDPVVRARATLIGARIALAAGKLEAAARDADAVTRYFHAQQLTRNEFEGLLLQARIGCKRRDRRAALAAADEAMRLAEEIRISSNNPALRASLWTPLRPAFDFELGLYAGVLACDGTPPDPAAALAIAEISRNRALADMRRRVGSVPHGGVDAQRRELFERLAQRRAQIETLSETVPANDARLKLLRDETAALMRELDLAGGALASAAKADGFADRSTVDYRAIPADTAVVEYWLGETRTIAWSITRHGARMFDLGPTSAVEATARALIESMHDWTSVPASERLRRSRELHRLIVAPLHAELARVRTIYFVPDGTLHAVPFAVLADGPPSAPRYLIDTHDLATAPALRGVTSSRAVHIDAGKALIVADPVYSRQDSRFAGNGAAAPAPVTLLSMEAGTLRGARSWTRLPGSGREASDIARLLSDGTDVEVLSGFAANRDNILARDLGNYQIMHFATHAIADTEAPQLSAVVLSTFDADGHARIGELFAGELAAQRVRAGLVVLSGCDTALGQASSGEGLLGMRYAAHASGARYVVASLWPVMDAAGSRLMRDMYRGIIDDRLSPVAALSRAMRMARRQWPDPALWGAYDVSSDGER